MQDLDKRLACLLKLSLIRVYTSHKKNCSCLKVTTLNFVEQKYRKVPRSETVLFTWNSVTEMNSKYGEIRYILLDIL